MDYRVVELETHSSLLEELNHCERLFDVRDLLFQTSPPLCQVLVHVTVLSIMSDMYPRLAIACAHQSCNGTYASAAWNSFKASSGLGEGPRNSATSA